MKRILSLLFYVLLSLLACARISAMPQGELLQLFNQRTFVNQNIAFTHFDQFFEDQQERLWGCDFSGELAVWDGTQFVRQVRLPGRVFIIFPYDTTDFLIGTERGLVRLNTVTNQVIPIGNITEAVYGIFEEPEGRLRVFTAMDVWVGEKTSLEFDRLCHWKEMDIVRTGCLPDGNYLLVTTYQGLWKYDPVSNALQDLMMSSTVDPSQEVMLDMVIVGKEVWVSTDRGLYHATAKQGEVLQPEEEFRGITGKYLHLSREGDLWVGTDRGLFVRPHGQTEWQNHRHAKNISTSLLNDCVWTIYQDRTGNHWIGVESGVSFTSEDHAYSYVDWTFGDYLKGNRVSCMLHDGQDRMWMGGADGLSMHDYKTGKTLLFDKMGSHNCIDNRIWSLYEDRQGVIWICTDESIAFYDEENETFRARIVIDFSTDKTSKWAYRILDTGDGYLWIASGSGGFMRVHRQLLLGKEATVVAESSFNQDNPQHPIGDDVGLRFFHDGAGTVWGFAPTGLYQLSCPDETGGIALSLRSEPVGLEHGDFDMGFNVKCGIWGMMGDTLCCYDPTNGKSRMYLPDDIGLKGSLLAVTDCGDDQICLLTSRCIALFDGKTGAFVPIIEQHDSEFRSLYWDETSGLLWLGGVDYCMVASLTRLLELQEEYSRPASVSFYSLEGNDLSVTFTNGHISEWSVPYTGYYYRLVGHDAHWIPVNRGMSIRYEALGPGNYKLLLGRCSPKNREMELLDQLDVLVPYPWYRSWWFYLLVLALVTFAVLSYIRHYSLRLQLKIAEADKQQLLEQYLAIKDSTLQEAVTLQLNGAGQQAKSLAEARQTQMDNVNRRWLEQLQKHIENHLSDEDFNVARLAELTGLNEKALYRRVKTLTGNTTIDYIRKLRMQHAAALLTHPEFSITEVMYMVGFTSSSYFSKCFESVYKMTPSEYRAKKMNLV